MTLLRALSSPLLKLHTAGHDSGSPRGSVIMGLLSIYTWKIVFDRHLKAELQEVDVSHWLAVGLMVRVRLLSMGAKQSKVYGPPKRGNLQDTMAVLSMDNVQIICLGSPFTTKDWPKEAHRYIRNTIRTE